MSRLSTQLTPAERRRALLGFSGALSIESHHLQLWPDLTWQQLYNELQFEESPVPALLEPEVARRNGPGGRPWSHRRTFVPQARLTLRHEGPVRRCTVSPDGRFILSTSRWGRQPEGIGLPIRHGEGGSSLHIWDAESGKEERTLRLTTREIACAWSPDGRFIVTGGTDRIVQVWDADSGVELRTLVGHTNSVTACAVSPDGRFVVSGSDNHTLNTLRLWDVEDWEELRPVRHGDAVTACAVSPDARFVVSGGEDRTLEIWETETGAKLRTLTQVWTSDRLAALARERGVSYETVTAEAWTKARSTITACAVSPDGRFIVSASLDPVLTVWDADTGAEVRTLVGHRDSVRACAISPDGRFIVSGGDDNTLKIWDFERGKELRSIHAHGNRISACAVSPDGRFIVSAGADGTVKIWDTGSIEALPTLAGHSESIRGCAMSSDGRFVVSASDDHTLKVWDVEGGRDPRTLTGHTNAVIGCAVSPDCRFVVSGGCDNTINVWDARSGVKVRSLRDDARVVFCAVTPDGRSIVSASIAGWHTGQSKEGEWRPVQEYGALKVWDAVGRGSRSRTLHAGMDHLVLACALSADGQFVLMGGQSGDLCVRDVENGEQVLRLHAPRNDVGGCAASPDGRFVVAGDYGGTLKTWSAESGEELRTLSADGSPVRACAVSPDGQFVVSGSGSTLKVWDAASSEELAMIPLLGTVTGVALHPWRPLAAAGDSAGAFYLIDLFGIRYGPIVVTPIDQLGDPMVRCPACGQELAVQEVWLGEVVVCANPGCGLELRVNPFIVTSRRKRWWRRGFRS